MNNTIKTNQSYQKFKEILTARHIISQWLSICSVFSKLFQIVSICFKLLQFVSGAIASGQQPARHLIIVICLMNKVCTQFNTL